jgi:hypothetical protein
MGYKVLTKQQLIPLICTTTIKIGMCLKQSLWLNLKKVELLTHRDKLFVQDFMRGMGEYFDRLNVSKDIRETTTAFVLGLQGMERNLFEVGIRQVLEQLDTGAENINNPLNEGFIGGLEYLEEFAPSLYDYFNDMFGSNL